MDNPVVKIAELALDLVDATKQEPVPPINLAIKFLNVFVVVVYAL